MFPREDVTIVRRELSDSLSIPQSASTPVESMVGRSGMDPLEAARDWRTPLPKSLYMGVP